MISVVAFLFVLLLCVVIHENGHYMAARFCGVQVHEFSFGMGPVVLQRLKWGTKWSFRALPLGGFVRLAGMGEELDGETVAPGASYLEKKPWQKLLILSAGSLSNMVLALVVAALVLWSQGVTDLSEPRVGALMPGYPAEAAGLQAEDRIIEVAGQTVTDWQSMTQAIGKASRQGESLALVVRRGTERLNYRLTPRFDEKEQRPLIGIQPGRRFLSIGESFGKSLGFVWALSRSMLEGLVELIARPGEVEVAGPLGIATMAGDAARAGWCPLMTFLAVISLNLGIINLLPIPALDGGRMIFAFFELLTGRVVPEELEGRIHFIGFVLLMVLIVLVTWSDISNLLRGVQP